MLRFAATLVALAFASAASATIFSFGGTFATDTPVTPFSTPGQFDVSFDLPSSFPVNNSLIPVEVLYLNNNVIQLLSAQLNIVADNGQQAFGLSFNDGTPISSTGIFFNSSAPFFASSDGVAGELITGSYTLTGGTVVESRGFDSISAKITNTTGLYIFEATDPIPDGAGPTARALVGPGGGIPEPASWAMLISGFGLVGAGLRNRRVHSLAAW